MWLDPPELTDTAARQHGVVSLEQARTAGMTASDVRARLRIGRWLRLFASTYLVDADRGVRPPLALAQSALLVHGADAVLANRTAARIHGIAGLRPADTVDVVVPPGQERHQRDGIRLLTRRIPQTDRTLVDGLRVTTAARSLVDVVLECEQRAEAVSAIDSALHLGLVMCADIASLRTSTRRRRGAARSRSWWDLADARAESPGETRLRLLCAEVGFPADDLQVEVRSPSGAVIGRADLWWDRDGRPLAGEFDGRAPHEAPAALFRDRQRQNGFVAAGVDTVRFTWPDLGRPAYIRSCLSALGVRRRTA